MALGDVLERQREERLQAERKKVDTNLELISEVQQLQMTVRDLQREVERLREELPEETSKVVERAARSVAPSMLAPVVVTVVCAVVSTVVLWRCVATKTGNVWRLVDSLRQSLGG